MRDMRLNCNVTRGEIDNTRRGRVVLKLWLFGQHLPHEIQLDGDCLRDLAGCHLAFQNKPLDAFRPLEVDLSDLREGVVGEITGSARLYLHKPTETGKFEQPVHVNSLRIEFFTGMGRVILECFGCKTSLKEISWQMSEADEFAQKATNFANWKAHIATELGDLSQLEPASLSNLYDEIQQRFADSIDYDMLEATLMGWDGIIAAYNEERELNLAEGNGDQSTEKLINDTTPDFEEVYDVTAEFSDSEWEEPASAEHPILQSIHYVMADFELQASLSVIPKGRAYLAMMEALGKIEEKLRALITAGEGESESLDNNMLGCRESLGNMMIAMYYLSELMCVCETHEGRRELICLSDEMAQLREEISSLRFHLHNL